MKLLYSLTFAVAFGMLSLAVYGQTTISSVPYTITSPGICVLANNFSYGAGSGAAISINSANPSASLKLKTFECRVLTHGDAQGGL